MSTQKKEVMIVVGAGQLSMAIARRVGFGMKIVLGDKKKENADTIAKIMNDAGFDVMPMEMDLSSRESILNLISEAQKYGPITRLVNGAGVSPSQAPIAAILKVDLYGTAVLLEEVGKVIAEGGSGVTISSQSGWRMPALTAEQDELLATTPTEELLKLEMLQPENIRDTLHAYQMAKRCNEKRVMAESVKWGVRAVGFWIAGYGVYAFLKRDIGSYMFLKNQFVFFDFEEPLILFLLDYIAVMGLFVCVGHYIAQRLKGTVRRRN